LLLVLSFEGILDKLGHLLGVIGLGRYRLEFTKSEVAVVQIIFGETFNGHEALETSIHVAVETEVLQAEYDFMGGDGAVLHRVD
jgi:hypothetical protein